MILTCPACSTRYMVEPPDLGRSGRRVRCAKCGHSWMQGPAQDLPKAVVIAAEADADADVEPRRAARKARFEPARKGLVGWLVFLVVVGGGFAAAYHFRQPIVDYWPPAARLYTELGIKLHVVGEGIEIKNLNLARMKRDGANALVVSGEISNTTNQAKDVPMLRGALLDSQQRELQHWIFSAGHDRLLPGEVAGFQTEVADPKPDATNILITFTAERESPGDGVAVPAPAAAPAAPGAAPAAPPAAAGPAGAPSLAPRGDKATP